MEGAERVAAAVERTADELDGQGDNAISGFGHSVASVMRQLAGGLRERDVEDFARELAALAWRNPGLFLAGSVALGFGIARFFKAGTSASTSASQGSSAARDAGEERNAADSLRSGANRAAEVTREQAGLARERVDRLLHEQPLMLGALSLAAGAIIGALLPTTEHEDRLLAEMRNKTVKDAAQKSRALYETARENAASYSAPDAGRTDDDASRARTSRPH